MNVRYGQLRRKSFVKETQKNKYGIPIRNTNQTVPATAMVQV